MTTVIKALGPSPWSHRIKAVFVCLSENSMELIMPDKMAQEMALFL